MEKFKIDPVAILKDFTEFQEMDSTGMLEFIIDHGQIRIYFQANENYGGADIRYCIHPNGTCEGKGICIYCGCTLFPMNYHDE